MVGTPSRIYFLLCLAALFSACSTSEETTSEIAPPLTALSNRPLQDQYDLTIKEFTDSQYPDNPDIGFRATGYNNDYFNGGTVKPNPDGAYSFEFYGEDTIRFHQVELDEFIPTIPPYIQQDSYLTHISLVNQEYNRNQVRFSTGEFTSNNGEIVRADIARNCLNSYLWEVIVYTGDSSGSLPAYHGWFDFPRDLYAHVFEEKNQVPFARYQQPLEHWQDPESEVVDLESLREEIREYQVSYRDQSDAMYPVAGARKKKYKEVIYPERFTTMRDLQTDSALFATFSPPGFYDRSNPKTTELGRFYTLTGLLVRDVVSKANADTLVELELTFQHRDGEEQTRLLIGGIDPMSFPELPIEEANSGWKSSMGIGNHCFYETYSEHQRIKITKNPYYALLLNAEGEFLDSHLIGVDGPIFHRDADNPQLLHLWLLSFERHALFGHYEIELPG